MTFLPVLTELKVEKYGLFPGKPHGSGIAWSFQPGISLVAGINGLGKTTLLMMLLRSFTGPYDLTGDGEIQPLNVTLPKNPVRLKTHAIEFFAQRVADTAENATVTLSAEIGTSYLQISRRLHDLFLESFCLDENVVDLPQNKVNREKKFQSVVADLMGLSSFVDVLLILHHVILLHENRSSALWDPNAQRQLLRALCLDKNDSLRVADLERSVQSADSQARNIHARITATEKDFNTALQCEANEENVLADLENKQKLLDACLEEASESEEKLEQLDEKRKDSRLELERAKIALEDATGAIERLKYTRLFQLFPSMDDTARLVLSRIMTEDRCLVCGSNAQEKRTELEQKISQGYCPACGSMPEIQGNVTTQHEFEQAKLDKTRRQVELAKLEEETKSKQLKEYTAQYDQTIKDLSHINVLIHEHKRENAHLRAQLPPDTKSEDYERTLKTLRGQYLEKKAERAARMQELGSLLKSKEDVITGKSEDLTRTFEEIAKELLIEEVRLVPVEAEPRYMQAPGPSDDRLKVPAYAAEMTAADHADFVRRKEPTDVSESQRELVDLAFRLALAKVFSDRNACTFVMETPEASLDGLAMERVGKALATFASKHNNRLVVTSNLTNAGIITALFGGPATTKKQKHERMRSVLNLLQVAAPNRALVQDHQRYETILHNAISGNS